MNIFENLGGCLVVLQKNDLIRVSLIAIALVQRLVDEAKKIFNNVGFVLVVLVVNENCLV